MCFTFWATFFLLVIFSTTQSLYVSNTFQRSFYYFFESFSYNMTFNIVIITYFLLDLAIVVRFQILNQFLKSILSTKPSIFLNIIQESARIHDALSESTKALNQAFGGHLLLISFIQVFRFLMCFFQGKFVDLIISPMF